MKPTRRLIVSVTAMLMFGGVICALPAGAAKSRGPDCTSDLGDPKPGTAGWRAAWNNTRYCSHEKWQKVYVGNPAYHAAMAANLAAAGPQNFWDPFREVVSRWAGKRGDYRQVRWTDSNGNAHRSVLVTPFASRIKRPLPGVIFLCEGGVFAQSGLGAAGPIAHAETLCGGFMWVAEMLAEAGYVTLLADLFPHDAASAIQLGRDATDYFVSTPAHPNPHNHAQFNPWHARLDRTRLGVTGHSGSASEAMDVGFVDKRIDAVVALDRSGPALGDRDYLKLRSLPVMEQLRDFQNGGDTLDAGLAQNQPPASKPDSNDPTTKYGDFKILKGLGADTMNVVIRSATHFDWTGFAPPGSGASVYGEQVAAYYMLTWFDRYLRGVSNPAVAADALARLTATSTFDGSSDSHSIGTGLFDPTKAAAGRSVEAGNVPITIRGQRIRNHLSFWYLSRFWLNGGTYHCADLRAGCPHP